MFRLIDNPCVESARYTPIIEDKSQARVKNWLRTKRQVEDDRVLQLDLREPDVLVERTIADICARFGKVISVRLHRAPTVFALIEMSTRAETFELVARLGGSTFGVEAIVHVQQALLAVNPMQSG